MIKEITVCLLMICLSGFASSVMAAETPGNKSAVVQFPQDYIDKSNQVQEVSQSAPSPDNYGVKVGEKGDAYINNNEFRKNYQSVQRGNDTEIIDCSKCKSGESCRNCHAGAKSAVVVNVVNSAQTQKTPVDRQYRYLPMQSENDSQTNPYFMMLSRQRLLAKTDSRGGDEYFESTSKKQTDQNIIAIQEAPKKNNGFFRSNLGWDNKFYVSLYGGKNIGGSAEYTSKIKTSSSSAFSNNFTADADYNSGKALGVALGTSYRIPFLSGFRSEIAASANDFTAESTINNKTYTVANAYGSGRLYSLDYNIYIDFLRQVSKIYPSIGGGIGLSRFTMNSPQVDSIFGPSYNLSAYLNYDISDSSSIFAGIRVRMMRDKDGLTNNSINKKADETLQNSYENVVDVKGFKLTTFEIGLRFS